MTVSEMLCHPFCNPDMLAGLEKCRTMEIASDVWEIEGFAGKMILLEPPSGNIFFLRDADIVLMMDSGSHAFYRSLILEILIKLRREGARHLVLTLSHGHWGHGNNNDVIYEAGYESVRFLLPENGFAEMNAPVHMATDIEKVREYYDPLKMIAPHLKLFYDQAKNFPAFTEGKYQNAWRAIESLPEEYDPDAAFKAYRRLLGDVLYPDPAGHIIARAEPLTLADRERILIGKTEFKGWRIGRFFIIHDASQSPGHICVYDPKNKLMITGDAAFEINPPFFDCDFNACIDICRKCLELAENGFIEIATDCRRTSQWLPRLLESWGLEPLDRIQLVDAARGSEECMAFYGMWVDYYTSLKNEVLLAHSRIGEADVFEIVEELGKSKNKNVAFKMDLTMPNIPSSPEMLVAKVMMEAGASRRVDGERITFAPVKKWSF